MHKYIAPRIRVVTFAAEQGFAFSSESPHSSIISQNTNAGSLLNSMMFQSDNELGQIESYEEEDLSDIFSW